MKKTVAALAALAVFVLLGLGAHRYSTLLETIAREPLVSVWQGPAELRVGEGQWTKVDVPKADLSAALRAAKPGGKAVYRFAVEVPPALRDAGVEVAFSPNWVVHRRWQAAVDGAWVASGHGVTESGDIVHQKVVVPLPHAAVEAGRATVTIAADVGPADFGIQHHGQILVGPATVLGRLHVEAEYAMGSYYLLFLTATGALFIFFALVYLLAETRPGFGAFVTYAFLTTAIHLSIGNFLEGVIPFSVRVWGYFLAKGLATTTFGVFLARVLFKEGLSARRLALFGAPALVALGLLASGAGIAAMHHRANGGLFVVVAFCLAIAARRGVRLDVVAFGGLYLGFLAWNFFVHKAQDFDYRPFADLAFFYFVAWLTMSELAVAQAKARVLESNFSRLHGFLARLVGGRLARHLTVRGEAGERAEREVAVLVFDLRHTNRVMARYGRDAALAALDEAIRLVAASVEARGGEVNKIVGDKVIAYWGLTGTPGDARAAAVAAVLDLRAALTRSNDQRGAAGLFPLFWSSGLAAGSVIAGRIGDGPRSDYGAFGEPVNAAFAAVAAAKAASFDCALHSSVQAPLADRVLVEPLADDTFALLALFEDGRPRFEDARWAAAYGERTAGGVVYEAGANQASFLPVLAAERKAA